MARITTRAGARGRARARGGRTNVRIHVRDLNAPRDSAAFKGIERKEEFVVLNADGSLPARAAKPKAPAKKG